ncbi:MAG: histidine kinase [Acidobacteria bacterium]|nr:histidine kinase [Acidobacteriota bacterium]MCI0627163.1 histidine kinase [Acidobacteriota bacterium]MCI0720684.1 histidine kinase [Acidobacteriota bacterium]
MTPLSAALLVNLLGFLTGSMLYGMLLVMAFQTLHPGRSRAASVKDQRVQASFLLFLTAFLGLLWNVGSLSAYGLTNLGIFDTSPWLPVLTFSALGFLPAVMVHSVVNTSDSLLGQQSKRWTIVTAYVLSGLSCVMHFSGALTNARAPSHSALRMLTFGFILLSLVLLLSTRGQAGRQRTFWISALAVFAVSALHLSYHDAGYSPWWTELLGHHASLPLVLAILYQDYRFALGDIFLKRALLLIALVMLASALYLTVAAPLLSRWDGRVHTEPREVALFLGLSIAVALFYPWVRWLARRFVDQTVLRRVDYRQLLGELSQQVVTIESTEVILDAAVARLEIALTAQDVRWLDVAGSSPVPAGPRGSGSVAHAWFLSQEDLKVCLPESRVSGHVALSGIDNPAAALLIPTADSPQYLLVVGELAGGRRLLSDDIAMLESLAHIVARRIDALRVTHERCQRDLKEQEIGRLATEAELRALRAQLNPHFLFNALTTIGYLIQTAPNRAMDTLMGLTGLLRRILKRSTGELVTLGEELELIEMYLAIERARFEERLRVKIDVPFELRALPILPLLLQPLVENAVKHGISPAKGGGEIVVAAELERVSAGPAADTAILCIRVQDTGKGASERELEEGRRRGVGLTNVESRLERYYGPSASLRIETSPGAGLQVKARLPVNPPLEAACTPAVGAANDRQQDLP